MLAKMRIEIDQSLQNKKKNVSAQRYEETVAQRMDDKLVDLFAIPSFEDWIGELSN
ncbi:MAG: hypothetical protein KDD62_13555 [Bdellovibrionales bacterium]|nr:hypothetical protein [Bdellovibrionales bacterium]